MTKVQDLTEIDALEDDDIFYVADASAPSAPDKKVPFSKVKPLGTRITHQFRFQGDINIPNIPAGMEATATFNINGVVVGDHLVFNPLAALPAEMGIMSARVSAADTAQVKFRNFGASNFTTATLASLALVFRAAA